MIDEILATIDKEIARLRNALATYKNCHASDRALSPQHRHRAYTGLIDTTQAKLNQAVLLKDKLTEEKHEREKRQRAPVETDHYAGLIVNSADAS